LAVVLSAMAATIAHVVMSGDFRAMLTTAPIN
jgi:hypothetical protein